MSASLDSILEHARVIPVLVIEDVAHAVPLARALLRGGLHTLEVTLRTSMAVDAIKAIGETLPECTVGAGTVRCAADVDRATRSGARFLVSPGTTPALIDCALARRIPLLPGISTPSEAMSLMFRGFRLLKFFPAEAAGGIRMLQALRGPLPELAFCPTGGISAHNAADYLSLTNVRCVGGSWMVPQDLVDAGDWAAITRLAAQAASLGGPASDPTSRSSPVD